MNWWKSSYSYTNGCVEVAFLKSSRSSATGNCVEVGTAGNHIHVRDSKNPDGPMLTFTSHEWEAFIAGVKSGEFDLQEEST
jgi:hypothetical protein